ncbi:MAG: hypothetical protein K8U03_26485 [Planctomycetia bacterium]|nr:hypothetical protein [Planctomycetia bacterium]
MIKQPAALLFACVVAVSAGGAQCHRPNPNVTAIYGPRVLTENPSTGDVIQVVNANSALIRSLYTTDAVMSVPGAPSLRANLALERQKRLRLRAETALTGAEVDMGSNDDVFWFWVRRNPPPTLYFCRHDKFAASAAKQVVPVDPEWLLDAIGLATFDPYHQHSTPQKNRNGKWEVRTTLPSVNGSAPMTKVTVVDDARGFVLEQHLYDERGTLVASALASRQWRDPATGAIVPQVIEINWPSTQFSLKFDVRSWTVNNIPADPAQLFTMPNYPGWAVVDLGDPNVRAAGLPAGGPNTTQQPATPVGGSYGTPIPTPTPYSNSGGFSSSTGMTAVPPLGNGNAVGVPSSGSAPYPAAPAGGRDLIGWAGAPTNSSAPTAAASPYANPYPATTYGQVPFGTAGTSGTSAARTAQAASSPPAAPGMLR